ncbi:MAG: alpha/beta fold hydrolase [Candidatus Binatia bacterium]
MEYRITPGRVQIGECSLYYECVGAGRPLIFLHGLGGNHLSWWQQVPYFMRWYQCITLDQRGFGLSQDPEGLFNQAHASDIGRLLDDLKLDKVVLVGQSMGGWTIVGYALEHPGRVAALVLCDTPGGIFPPGVSLERPREPLRFAANPPLGSLPTYAKDYFVRRPDLALLYEEFRVLGAQPPADALQRIASLRYDLNRVRQHLQMPVLCMVGEDDLLVPPRMVRAVADFLPNARLVSVPDCGHSIYFEHPAIFNQLLRDFLIDVGYAG